MARFLISFNSLLCLLFLAELTAPVQRDIVEPWTRLLAGFSGSVASWLDPRTVVDGTTLLNPVSGFGVRIVAGCNGVEAVLILSAAILAFPAPVSRKAVGITLGVVAIQLLNLVRVVSLFFLGQWSMPAFDFAHLYAWQALILLDALIVWLVWLQTVPAAPRVDG